MTMYQRIDKRVNLNYSFETPLSRSPIGGQSETKSNDQALDSLDTSSWTTLSGETSRDATKFNVMHYSNKGDTLLLMDSKSGPSVP